MGHTKGKWEVLKLDDGKTINVSTFEADGCSDICYMNEGLDYEANAQLIATAPKLLLALENWFTCNEDHPMLCRCGRDGAREAINQARGE